MKKLLMTQHGNSPAVLQTNKTNTPSTSNDSQAARPGAPTGWRKWLFRLSAAVLMPTLLLLLLELGLRLGASGYPTEFFIEGLAPSRKEICYIENRAFGKRFFAPGLETQPLKLVLPTVKPKGTYRIFVLGESAAQGFPNPTCGFARVLEVMLRHHYPEQRFEIVNTAMVAINSHVVLPIARECAALQPDLFVVHLGNNEVVGPFGAAGVLGTFAPRRTLIQASLFAKTTRTGQVFDSFSHWLGTGAGPQRWAGMAMFANSRVGADDPQLTSTTTSFRANLHDICAAGRAAGARVLVCTIPVNLKDSPPFAALHRPDLTPDQTAAWDRAYQAGITLAAAGRDADALQRFADAACLDDRHADLTFRVAQCEERLGSSREALAHYQRACDLDALRFRADSRLNATIRDVAGSFGDAVELVDAERAFAAHSPLGIPGENLFLEHVHMNFTGNYTLARALLPKIAAQLATAKTGADLTEHECAERLAYTGSTRLADEARIRRMFRSPPFSQQLDGEERGRRWDARLAALQKTAGPETVQQEAALYRQALAAAPHDWMLRESYAQLLTRTGAIAEAIAQYEAIVQDVPHHDVCYKELGCLNLQLGNAAAARICLETACMVNPSCYGHQYQLACVLASQGKVDEAHALFAAKLRHDPQRADGLALYAKLLKGLGQHAEARGRLEEALQLEPKLAPAHMLLGEVLLEEGQQQRAIAHFEDAGKADPGLLPEVQKRLAQLQR